MTIIDETLPLDTDLAGYGAKNIRDSRAAINDVNDSKLPLTGGTMTGNLVVPAMTINGGVPWTTFNDGNGGLPPTPRKTIYCGVSAPVSLEININAYSQGRAWLIMASSNWSNGNNTHGAIYLVRCGFDGDNYSTYYLRGDSDCVTFSVVSSILYASILYGTNSRYICIPN